MFRVGDVLRAFGLKRALKSDIGFSVPCSNSSTASKRRQGPPFQEDKSDSVCSGLASPSGGDGLFFPSQDGKAGSVLCHGSPALSPAGVELELSEYPWRSPSVSPCLKNDRRRTFRLVFAIGLYLLF